MPAASVNFADAVITLRYGAAEVPARGSAGAQRGMNEHEFKSFIGFKWRAVAKRCSGLYNIFVVRRRSFRYYFDMPGIESFLGLCTIAHLP